MLIIINGIWVIPYFFSSPISDISIEDFSQIESASDSLLAGQGKLVTGSDVYRSSKQMEFKARNAHGDARQIFSPQRLFPFDPNTASANDWRELGMPDKTILTLQHYLSKGGRIRQADDLKKIYGFPEEAFTILKPYLRFDEKQKTMDPEKRRTGGDSYPDWEKNNRKEKVISPVLLNSSDSADWEALPGIGPRLSSRILSFRSKLGGFSSVDQVSETYGIAESTFLKIKPYLVADEAGMLHRLNLNKASLEELQAHPYISFQLAKVIIAYRNQHGPFTSKDDLLKIALVSTELYRKISPYLAVD